MIDKSDIIDCKAYQRECCDFLYADHVAGETPDLDNIPPSGVVHVPLDQIEHFFERIDSNGHTYVVVSSCSDFGLAYQQDHPVWGDMVKWVKMRVGPALKYGGISEPPRCDINKCRWDHPYSVKCHSYTRATFPHIPNNVHHWFVTNLMISGAGLTAIPFGIAEGKTDILYEKMQKALPLNKRESGLFVSWQDYTYDRWAMRKDLVESFTGRTAPLNITTPVKTPELYALPPGQPLSYEEYLDCLGKYLCVISPPGNGEDCYRTMESVYMDAITFVQGNTTNKLLYANRLPINLYKDVDDIKSIWSTMYRNAYNRIGDSCETAKLSYWKKKILAKRAEVLP